MDSHKRQNDQDRTFKKYGGLFALKAFPLQTSKGRACLYFLISKLGLSFHILLSYFQVNYEELARAPEYLQLIAPSTLSDKGWVIINILSYVIKFLILVSIVMVKKYDKGIGWLLCELSQRIFPFTRYLLQLDLLISGLLLLGIKTMDFFVPLLLSALLNLFSTFFNQNYTRRKDLFIFRSWEFAIIQNSIAILFYVIDVISVRIVRDYPIVLYFMVSAIAILSFLMVFFYFWFGFINFKQPIMKLSILVGLSSFFSLCLAICVDVSTSYIHIHINFLMIFPIVLFLFYNTTQRIYLKHINNPNQLELMMHSLFTLVEQASEDTDKNCIIKGLLSYHWKESCSNPECFTNKEVIYDSKKRKTITSAKFSNDYISMVKFYLKCVIEKQLENNPHSVQLSLKYSEFLFLKLKNTHEAMRILNQLAAQFHLSPFQRLRFERLFEVMKEESSLICDAVYGKKLDIEFVIRSEEVYSKIQSMIELYLHETKELWKSISNEEINISTLRASLKPNFQLVDQITNQWRKISKYLSFHRHWRFEFICFNFFIKNQKPKAKFIEEFGAIPSLENIFRPEVFQIDDKSQEKQIQPSILFDRQTFFVHAQVINKDLIITRVSQYFQKVLIYSADEIIGSHLEKLLPPKFQKSHKEMFDNWISKGYTNNESSHKIIKGILIDKCGMIISAYKMYKQFIALDGNVEYVCLLKRNQINEGLMIIDGNCEIEAVNRYWLQIFNIDEIKFQYLLGMNFMVFAKELMDMSRFAPYNVDQLAKNKQSARTQNQTFQTLRKYRQSQTQATQNISKGVSSHTVLIRHDRQQFREFTLQFPKGELIYSICQCYTTAKSAELYNKNDKQMANRSPSAHIFNVVREINAEMVSNNHDTTKSISNHLRSVNSKVRAYKAYECEIIWKNYYSDEITCEPSYSLIVFIKVSAIEDQKIDSYNAHKKRTQKMNHRKSKTFQKNVKLGFSPKKKNQMIQNEINQIQQKESEHDPSIEESKENGQQMERSNQPKIQQENSGHHKNNKKHFSAYGSKIQLEPPTTKIHLTQQTNIFLKQEQNTPIISPASLVSIGLSLRTLTLVIIIVSIMLAYHTIQSYSKLTTYASMQILIADVREKVNSVYLQFYGNVISPWNSRYHANIQETISLMEHLQKETLFKSIIFDRGLNPPGQYAPFVSNVLNNNTIYDQIELPFIVLSAVMALSSPDPNFQPSAFDIGTIDTYLIGEESLYHITLNSLHSSLQNNIILMKQIQIAYIIGYIGVGILILGVILVCFCKFDAAMLGMIEMQVQLNQGDLQLVSSYYNTVSDIFKKIKKWECHLKQSYGSTLNSNTICANSSENNAIMEEQGDKEQLLQSNGINMKSMSASANLNAASASLNKKTKRLIIGKEITAFRRRIVLWAIAYFMIIIFMRIAISSYLLTKISTIQQLEIDGYNAFINISSIQLSPIAIQEAIIKQSHQMFDNSSNSTAEPYKTAYTPFLASFNPIQYAKAQQELGFIAKTSFIGSLVDNNDFYTKQKQYYFYNPCDSYLSLMDTYSYSSSLCASLLQGALGRGIIPFASTSLSLLRSTLANSSSASVSSTKELQIASHITSLYLQDLYHAWLNEMIGSIEGISSMLKYILLGIIVVVVISHVLIAERQIMKVLQDEYQFYRRVFQRMMPESVITGDKMVRARLVVDGILQK